MSPFLYSYQNFKLKFFILSAVTSSIVFANNINLEYYSGCGNDEITAREELAKSISITVKTTFDKKEALVGDKATKSLELISNQTTNLNLTDVIIDKQQNENGQICAKVSKESLKKSLESAKIEVQNFTPLMLVGSAEEKRKVLNHKIEVCESGLKLASLFADSEAGTVFQNKLIEFQKFLFNDNFQTVKFNIQNDSALEIFIDGENNKSHKINSEIAISSGSHQYLIRGANICDIHGKFEVLQNKNMIINNINLKDFYRPKIVFTTNQEIKYVKINLDGDEVAINKEITLNKCSGNVSYSASYNDGTYSDIAVGTISEIEPNMTKTVYLPFLSIGDIKALQNEVSTYMNSDRLEFLYSYSLTTVSANDQVNEKFKKDTNNIELNLLTHRRFFRYGVGALIGSDDFSNSHSKLIELYYYGAIQFSSFGQYDLPMRIGSFSFIPYVGLKFGLAYHEYKLENGDKIWKHPAEHDADSNTDDYDFEFERDLFLLKPTAGIDFIISKGFALKIFAEQSLKIDKRLYIGSGLSVEF